MRIRSLDQTEWSIVAKGFEDLSFEQTGPYTLAAAARIGARAVFLAIEHEGVPIAAAALRTKCVPGFGCGIAWAPAGPLILPKANLAPNHAALGGILTALRDHVVRQEGHIFRFRMSGIARQSPEAVQQIALAAGFTPTLRAPLYRSMALDLTRGTQALAGALNGKWRTDLRYAQKSGLVLDVGSSPVHHARFLAMFETVRSAKGFSPDIAPQFHFPLDGPDYTVETLLAVKDGQDVAGIVVGTAGGCTTYLFGATTEAGRPLRAGYFLTWEAIQRAHSKGLSWYDLGGIDVEANPSVARFKDRINGLPLFAESFEARPPGILPRLLLRAEALRTRMKRQ